MSPESILITGGTGFLGSHLVNRLLSQGHPIVLLKRSGSNTSRIASSLKRLRTYDIDREDPARAFRENTISTVIHCATRYGRQSETAAELVQANVAWPLSILDLAAAAGVRTFINSDSALSAEVNPYALSKRQFTDWLPFFSGRIQIINLALEHFYGAGDDYSKFVTRLVRDLLAEVPSIDLTPGEQRRDFIYVDDVLAAFDRILGAAPSLGPGLRRFSVGSAQPVRIRELAELIKQVSGNSRTELRFGALPYRPNELMESRADLAAIRSLGWSPSVSLEEGLRRMIEAERGGKTS